MVSDSNNKSELEEEMNNNLKNEPLISKPKCTCKTYIYYGVGYFSCGWTTSVIGFFILTYFIDILYIRPSHYSIIQFTIQAYNAISDPMAGLLSDLTKTRFGRRKPWMFISTFFLYLSFILLFYKISFKFYNISVVYYTFCLLLFYTSQTAYNIPYLALVMDISDFENERNILILFQSAFYTLGIILGTVFTSINIYLLFSHNKPMGLLISGLIGGLLSFIFNMVTIFKTEEKERIVKKKTLREILKSLYDLLKIRSYLLLTGIYALSNIAMQSMQANFDITLKHVFKFTDTQRMISVFLILTSAIIFIFVEKFIITYIGKKTTYYISMSSYIIVNIFILFMPPKIIWLGYIVCFLAGIGTGSTLFISSCMIPDVIDDDYIKNRVSREGLFFSYFIFFQKIALGSIHAISSYVLDINGYIRGSENQTEHVKQTLRYLMSLIPIISVLLSFVFLYFYPLTTNKINENKRLLARVKTENIKID